MRPGIQKFLNISILILGIYLAIQYLLPLFLPFLLGTALALAAEPIVCFACQRLRMPRGAASGLGVTMAFSFIALIIMVLCAFAVRELRTLAGILPDMEDTVLSGMESLSVWMMNLAQKVPAGLGTLLAQNVSDFFSGGAALIEKVMSWLLNFATGLLSRVPGSALLLGTAIISSFMISAKLPRLKVFFRSRFPQEKLRPLLDTLSRLKSVIGGWLKAQLKLCGVTFLLCTAGLLLLRVTYAPLWALLIALVDAFPILGVGTALIPWSLISFLQGDRVLAFGLLGLYALCAATRSMLEPRLVGKQLGLDPLVTLVALYCGYRLWGFAGMILAPMLAVTIVQLAQPGEQTH